MKTSIYILLILTSSLLVKVSNAQVNICVWCASNMNLQPGWGPVGYEYADYYYLPAIEVYYNVPERQFIYEVKGNWIINKALPARLATFNLYHAHKVVINDVLPYFEHATYKAQYASLKNDHAQHAIRDSHDIRYTEAKLHTDRNVIATNHASSTTTDISKIVAIK